jgi:hypothetical protein
LILAGDTTYPGGEGQSKMSSLIFEINLLDFMKMFYQIGLQEEVVYTRRKGSVILQSRRDNSKESIFYYHNKLYQL